MLFNPATQTSLTLNPASRIDSRGFLSPASNSEAQGERLKCQRLIRMRTPQPRVTSHCWFSHRTRTLRLYESSLDNTVSSFVTLIIAPCWKLTAPYTYLYEADHHTCCHYCTCNTWNMKNSLSSAFLLKSVFWLDEKIPKLISHTVYMCLFASSLHCCCVESVNWRQDVEVSQ